MALNPRTKGYHQGFSLLLLILLAGFRPGCHAQFVKGADIGWLQQMEATGYLFYDTAGVQKECLQILKEHGMNSIRLRVWVNPSNDKTNGHCSKKEVTQMAIRARNMGFRVMINFHYSDTWADPGHQTKPAAWSSHSFSQLLKDLYDHTYEVLDTLKSVGALPEWVQIGNEITWGMLWPDGSTGNWDKLAQLLNKGYEAAKTVDHSIRVILHVDQGNNNSRFRNFFDNARNRNVQYDIIGMSYYPYWLGSDYTATISDLAFNLNDMAERYGKEVMVVEVGGDYTKVGNTFDMLVAVMEKVWAVPDGKGLGALYWEPQGEKSWSGYQLSCWGSDHRPTAALQAFLTIPAGINGSPAVPPVSLMPNPCKGGAVSITTGQAHGTVAVRVYRPDGSLFRERTIPGRGTYPIDLSLPRGMYIVTFNSGSGAYSQKLAVY